MNIEVKDDGKKKWQSFQATITVDQFNTADGWCTGCEIVGLGADETEARSNLALTLEKLKEKLAE
jgi:hypothetical protein